MINEEPDKDKILLSINYICKIINDCLSQNNTAGNIFETSITSYFFARIGEYKGVHVILKALGFELNHQISKGLILSMKKTPLRYKIMKKNLPLLNSFLEFLKNWIVEEQFLCDFNFN